MNGASLQHCFSAAGRRAIGPVGRLAAAGCLVGMLVLPGLLCRNILLDRDAPKPSDAIIVLGGGNSSRARVAADLFRSGLAPFVLISGTGDCRRVQNRLGQFGVPSDHTVLECRSRSTRENALFSAAILRERGLRHAILVTSWQHSGRAARSFARLAPDLVIASYPTEPRAGFPPVRSFREAAMVYDEYAKFAWYCVAYRICP